MFADVFVCSRLVCTFLYYLFWMVDAFCFGFVKVGLLLWIWFAVGSLFWLFPSVLI